MKIFGIVGWKNNGKTGLMERLVAEIDARGFSVSTIKHAHHRFDVDREGTDSFRHRQAGAQEVLLSSKHRWALMHEGQDQTEPTLTELLGRLQPVDLVLIEGYKRAAHAKMEAHRVSVGKPLLAKDDPAIVAIASDAELNNSQVPVFSLDDTTEITDFILGHVGLI